MARGVPRADTGGKHRARSTEERRAAPRMQHPEQARLLLELIREEAAVQSPLDAKAWSKLEMDRVRSLFASAVCMGRLRARLATVAPEDVRLREWGDFQVREARAGGSADAAARSKQTLKTLRRMFDADMRAAVVPRVRTATQAVPRTQVRRGGESQTVNTSASRLEQVAATATTVLIAERAAAAGLSEAALRGIERPRGRVGAAPPLADPPNHTLFHSGRRTLVFREGGSRGEMVAPVPPDRTAHFVCEGGPATLREACARAARGPPAHASLPRWVQTSSRMVWALRRHNGWALATLESVRDWAAHGGKVSPLKLLSSDVSPTIVRATSGRLMTLELVTLELLAEEGDSSSWGTVALQEGQTGVRLNLMGAEQAAFAMSWWAMPELADAIRREARFSESAAWALVGDSMEYHSAIEIAWRALLKLRAWGELEQLQVIEYNAGVGVMSRAMAQLDSRVRLVAAVECWDVARRVLRRLHGDELLMPVWSHTAETAAQLMAAVPEPAVCIYSWECRPYAGRNRQGTPSSEERASKIEPNLAELASVVESWRELRPTVIIVENVGSLTQTFVLAHVWERACGLLTSIEGYEWEFTVLKPEEDLDAFCARTRLFAYGWRTRGTMAQERGRRRSSQSQALS